MISKRATAPSAIKTYESLDEAFLECVRAVLGDGIARKPRGYECHELLGVSFRISNPRRRLILVPARKWSLYYAIGEFFWHLAGSDDLSWLSYYSRKWRQFSDDGIHVAGSCYGHRIFRRPSGESSQWDSCRELLLANPDTRRAVLSIRAPEDAMSIADTRDSACCCTLQLLCENGKLNLIAYMRSNDLYLGFGYDVFLFTMMQELFASELGLKIGWYQHIAGSLHLYEKDRARAEEISLGEVPDQLVSMQEMGAVDALPLVLEHERYLRTATHPDASMSFDTHRYWANLLQVLLCFRLRKDGRSSDFDALRPQLAESLLMHFPWLI